MDSPFSVSYSETYLSPGEDEDSPCKDYVNTVCPTETEGPAQDFAPEYALRRRVSDVASSGVVSLDEEEEEEEEERAADPSTQWAVTFQPIWSKECLKTFVHVFLQTWT